MTQQNDGVIKIENQENCGKKMLCAQFDLCRHFTVDSEPCNYEMGYHSDDCLSNINAKKLLQERLRNDKDYLKR
ncbi:MAG: hypothetical protein NT091_03890 [Candidatus Falkowbacteria bacterium]|nr:hypothetical protein [Candidatus Falkowbacteria bacterium]